MFGLKNNPPPVELKNDPPPVEPGLKLVLNLSEPTVIRIVTVTLAILLTLVAGSNGLANLLLGLPPSAPATENRQSP